jgi:hypothetical protein
VEIEASAFPSGAGAFTRGLLISRVSSADKIAGELKITKLDFNIMFFASILLSAICSVAVIARESAVGIVGIAGMCARTLSIREIESRTWEAL